ncbi:protein MODIFYING WALL LIGNIN-1-like [Andrographis paniculata]|uniref:protein MODIFYING WALL LIGNIN-1-like n=1 Tax=Andrographis paniculata TaxID=175694 RepID=UPI0021E8417D|nr:protein MODIFYING WALL LIGNIN-1-like [Andrographis paniculata]
MFRPHMVFTKKDDINFRIVTLLQIPLVSTLGYFFKTRSPNKATVSNAVFFPLSKLQAAFLSTFLSPPLIIPLPFPLQAIRSDAIYMERRSQYGYALFFAAITTSAILSSAFCVASEFKKSKKNDLKFDGKLCYLPGSHAFELGIAALICLSISQVIGSSFICGRFRSRARGRRCRVVNSTVPCGLAVLSWITFAVATVLISCATSMSRSQAYGEGWLDGECYLVKDGVYIGSAVLSLLAMFSTVGSAVIVLRKRKAEDQKKVNNNNNKNSDTGVEEHVMRERL